MGYGIFLRKFRNYSVQMQYGSKLIKRKLQPYRKFTQYNRKDLRQTKALIRKKGLHKRECSECTKVKERRRKRERGGQNNP